MEGPEKEWIDDEADRDLTEFINHVASFTDV